MQVYFRTISGKTLILEVYPNNDSITIRDFIKENKDKINEWLIENNYINRPISVSFLNLILKFIHFGKLVTHVDFNKFSEGPGYLIIRQDILPVFEQLRKITAPPGMVRNGKIPRVPGYGSPFVRILEKYGINLREPEIIPKIIFAMNEKDEMEKNSKTRKYLVKKILNRNQRTTHLSNTLPNDILTNNHIKNLESEIIGINNTNDNMLRSSALLRKVRKRNHSSNGGSQFISIPGKGKRKVRYQKNGRAYVIVNKKKLKL